MTDNKNEKIRKVKLKSDFAAKEFRKYSKLGLCNESLKPFQAYMRIKGVCKSEEEAFRLLAVYDTIRLLKYTDCECAKAVESIYFYDRGRKPQKNQISLLVRRFAYENNLDERTVYRRLKKAKDLFYYLAGKEK